MSDNRVTLAELLARRRDKLGLSDDQAAEQLGVVQATFSRWRSGRVVPDDDRVPVLAAWLQLDQNDVALALSAGRRNRPADPVSRDDLLAEIAQLRSEVAELRRGVRPAD
jgi:transcriptional regulator with XRE-family HTH domain